MTTAEAHAREADLQRVLRAIRMTVQTCVEDGHHDGGACMRCMAIVQLMATKALGER